MYKQDFFCRQNYSKTLLVTKASKKRDELNLRRKKIQNEGISFLRELNFRILVISLWL